MKYLKYLLGFLVVIVPCIVAVLIYNDKITQDSPRYYKQGVELYDKGDYENAYYNFNKISKISPLYAMALYKQAKSAQKVGDYNTAILKYTLFLDKVPESVFAKTARRNLAKCYFYIKKYEESKSEFQKLNADTKNINPEDLYYIGIIEKTVDKKKSAEYFKEYLIAALADNFKNSPNSLKAAEELASPENNLNDEDNKLIGITYYKNRKYNQSLEFLSKIPVDKCWDYLVLANHYAGNKAISKKLIESGIQTYSDKISEENLYEIYDIYTSYMKGTKLKNRTQMYNIIKNNNLTGQDYAAYKLAAVLPNDKAVVLYNDIVQKFPKSKYAPEALWHVFWNSYKNRDYKTAESLALAHIKNYQKVKSSPKMEFWLAKTELKLNKQSEYHNYLSKLAAKYPDNYYGVRAESLISKRNNFWTTNPANRIPINQENIEFPISLSDIEIKDLKLINTLLDMGDYEVWPDADFKNKIVESWFAKQKGQKALSIILAKEAISQMDIQPLYISPAYKLEYPIYYAQDINTAGQKLGIDPFLILSLIKEESHFNENARSSVNAAGLMQLMPSTAEYIINKLGADIDNLSNLDNARINMYLGCNYLKYLENRFNNDLLAVAAYNGGEGSVSRWINNGIDDTDEFIENIPYEETKNYVKKVFKSYNLYKKIYNY